MLTPNLHLVTRLRMNGAITSIPPTRLHRVYSDFTIFIIANMLTDVYGDLWTSQDTHGTKYTSLLEE